MKYEFQFLVVIFLVAVFTVVNTYFVWVPVLAPLVLMISLVAIFLSLEKKNGN
jgi:hypothetical protein